MKGPLKNARHEVFAQAIAGGHTLRAAYAFAGFSGRDPKLSWKLRHRPEVDARVRELLESRVKAETRRFARREKSKGDLLERALRELETIAFSDIGEVLDWRREPKLNDGGEVVGVSETIQVRDSAAMPAQARKSIKAVFTKGGALRVDLHDKRAALEAIIKLLSSKDNPPQPSLTVNQTNIGQMDALDVARRVSFLLAAARAGQAPLVAIDTRPVSTETEGAQTE